jgi:TRAP-type mannitol/chloroaromatic compound transport system substrate-binding protein
MDRRSFIKKAGLAAGGAAVSALAAPALAQTAPEIKWRLTSGFPRTVLFFNPADVLAKAVAEMTDNKFQIQTFQNGEIIAQANVVDAIQQGTVEAAHTCSYYHFGKDPAFAFGTCVPYGLNPRQENAWFYYGGGNELLNAFYAKYNITAYPGGNSGTQMGGWWRKEIKTVDDLKGIKFRVGGFGGAVLAKLGVVPQSIPAGDIYTSLEKGVIDAAEWIGPYDDEKLGLNKIATNYYYPGWWEGATCCHFFFNTAALQKLPKNYQAILENAAAMANVKLQAQYDKENPAALRRLVQSGAQLRPFPAEIMDASFKAATDVCNEYSATNAEFKKFWDAVKPARNEGFLWEQLADGAYDNFMMAKQRAGLL